MDTSKKVTRTSVEKCIWIGLLCTAVLFALTQLVAQITPANLGDIPVYQQYMHLMRQGQIPYHGLNLEYPPGVLPFIVLATPVGWLFGGSYAAGYIALTFAAIAAYFGHRYWVGGQRAVLISAMLFLPLLQFFFFNLDIFAVLSLYGAVYAVQQKRYSWSAALFAISTLIKGYPGVCLLGLFWIIPAAYRRRYLSIFAGIMVAVLLPVAVLAPHGLWYAITYHTGRPIEYEATGGAIGFLLHWAGQPLQIFFSHGSWSVMYTGEKTVGFLSSILLALSLGAISGLVKLNRLAKQPALISLLLLTAYMLLFKVGSPQYFIAILMLAPLASTELTGASYKQLLAWCLGTGTVIWLLFITFFTKARLATTSYAPILATLATARAVLLTCIAAFLIVALKTPKGVHKG